MALKETTAFDAVLAEYKLGHLASVQRLDGFPAFDANKLAALVSLDKIASLAGDESESVRQLVATTLSTDADPKWTDTLIKLVQDTSVEIAREAAVGLGKIASEKAMQPLVDALSRANKESREKFLQALRDGVGANGLVLALKTVKTDNPDSEKFQTKQIFDMLKELEDPRGGDALYAYIEGNAKPHWKFEAAMRMAEIGDVRAAEFLGWRMAQDPLKLYNEVDWPELRRDDNERVYGARMLADLAVLHPEKRDYLLKVAEPRRSVVGRPGEQAAAARQRDALPRARRLAEGAADAHEVGGPEGQAPGGGRAAAVPGDVGDGAERAALPRLDARRRGRGASSRSSSTAATRSSTSRGTRSCRAA